MIHILYQPISDIYSWPLSKSAPHFSQWPTHLDIPAQHLDTWTYSTIIQTYSTRFGQPDLHLLPPIWVTPVAPLLQSALVSPEASAWPQMFHHYSNNSWRAGHLKAMSNGQIHKKLLYVRYSAWLCFVFGLIPFLANDIQRNYDVPHIWSPIAPFNPMVAMALL